MADNIGVLAVSKLKSDRDSSWIGIGINIGNVGYASGV